MLILAYIAGGWPTFRELVYAVSTVDALAERMIPLA